VLATPFIRSPLGPANDLRGQTVVVMQTVQHRDREHLPGLRIPWQQLLCLRYPLPDPLIRSGAVEVGDVFLQDPDQIEHAKHQHVIQTLPPQTPHEPFTDRIRLRHFMWRVDHLNAGCPGHTFKAVAILLVIVTDQVLRLLVERSRLAQLLCHLLIRRVFRHSKVHHPPDVMLHDNKRMNRLEGQRNHWHKITGPDVLPVRLLKRRPRLPRRRLRARRLHVFLDRPLRYLYVQLQQLAVDAFRAPPRFLQCYPLDQRNRLGRQALWLGLHTYARLNLPKQPEALPVPA
jgi:hypothetical protein